MDPLATNYNPDATYDDNSCCYGYDGLVTDSLACEYIVGGGVYCVEGGDYTSYYNTWCNNSIDWVDSSTHVPTDSVDRFLGDTPAIDVYGNADLNAFGNFNYIGNPLTETKHVSILNKSFYSEEPLTFTGYKNDVNSAATLSDYDTYLQGIMVDLSSADIGLSVSIAVGGVITNALYMDIYCGDGCLNGWIPASAEFVPGSGFLMLRAGGPLPGNYIKFYLEND
jgi:hypothetical protein